MKLRTESLAADAATDEQMALELLEASGQLPNLKILNRDTSHLSRRQVTYLSHLLLPYLSH